jgi:hypothetical protein
VIAEQDRHPRHHPEQEWHLFSVEFLVLSPRNCASIVRELLVLHVGVLLSRLAFTHVAEWCPVSVTRGPST